MKIKFSDFIIRPWKEGDELSLVENANNKKIWRNLRDIFPHPYTLEDAEKWIASVSSEKPTKNFAIVVNDSAVGGIGIALQSDVYKKSAELGYWIGEKYWNRGIMTRAVKGVTRYSFKKFDICRLYANVFEWNTASMKVLQKAGFEREARLRKCVSKNGKIGDQIIYAIVS